MYTAKTIPTQRRLFELFDYDADTGDLWWKVGNGHGLQPGDIAGSIARGQFPRIKVTVDGWPYYAHRLIWMLVYGAMPTELLIDHIDGNGTNNRITNLRLVTKQGNAKNCGISSLNTTGRTGVQKRKGRPGTWRVYITIDGRETYLGSSRQFEEACAMREAAEKKYGYFPNKRRNKRATPVDVAPKLAA
jgi:hypothetical protein